MPVRKNKQTWKPDQASSNAHFFLFLTHWLHPFLPVEEETAADTTAASACQLLSRDGRDHLLTVTATPVNVTLLAS